MRSDVGRGQRGFYEVEDVPYTQFFHKDYAFHGAFWHNNFGQPPVMAASTWPPKTKTSAGPMSPRMPDGFIVGLRWACL